MKYIIHQKQRPLIAASRGQKFRIAFDKAVTARNVMHCMHPSMEVLLTRGDQIKVTKSDLTVNMEVDAFVFIKKHDSNPHHPMSDGGFHLETWNNEQVFKAVFEENHGMIIPYNLVTEDQEEFVFRCQVLQVTT